MMTFKNASKRHNGSKIRRCPFCRCSGGYLPLEKNTLPIKNINKEYELIKFHAYHDNYDEIYKIAKENDFLNKDKCQALIKTG